MVGPESLTAEDLARAAAEQRDCEPCDCLWRVNIALQKSPKTAGCYLDYTTSLSTGQRRARMVVERHQGRGKAPCVVSKFCPFCGVAYDPQPERLAAEARERRQG